MKPVAIIRFSLTEGPGYLADTLDAAAIPWRLIRIDEEDVLPSNCHAYSGIAMMGGPMSVNDPLPWIPPLLELIRQAVASDVPLIGHCLGGQLISKALGGEITDNKCKEMGWQRVDVVEGAEAGPWFGGLGAFTTFQWHYQTFSIPPGATRVLRNMFCENQAFVLGPHIGFQCHIEMTEAMVRMWCESDGSEIFAESDTPSVQPVSQILGELAARVKELNRVADGVYSQWIAGLKQV